MSNFTAERPELSPDREMPLRAFEWLTLRWHLRPHVEAAEASVAAARRVAGEEKVGAGGSAGGSAGAGADRADSGGARAALQARQALYDAQLAREVRVMVEEVLPAIETNAAQGDEEVLGLLLRQLGHAEEPPRAATRAWLVGGREWRGTRAAHEARMAALRLYAETGSLAEAPPQGPRAFLLVPRPAGLGLLRGYSGSLAALRRGPWKAAAVRPRVPAEVADPAALRPLGALITLVLLVMAIPRRSSS